MLRLDEGFYCYNIAMSKTILYIDGENIRHYLKSVLVAEGIGEKDFNLENFDLSTLFDQVLQGLVVAEKRYYAAKLRFHKDTPSKSNELILKQRIQKSNLEASGIKFILGGNVRAQDLIVAGKKKTIFREKGVDVRMAVDLVSLSCDKAIQRAIVCSSDSDLQPAIAETRKRGVEVIYLGFENSPNKGLTYTTNRTVLFRNSEVAEVVPILS